MGKLKDFFGALFNNPSIYDDLYEKELADLIATNPDSAKRISDLEKGLKVGTDGKKITKPVVEQVGPSSKKPTNSIKARDEKAVQRDER